MTEDNLKRLKECKGKIEIEVNGLRPVIRVQANDVLAVLVAMNSCFLALQKEADLTEQEARIVFDDFNESIKSCAYESREMSEVAHQILVKTGLIDETD